MNVTVLNNGKDRSKPEILHLFLDGENSIPIGSIEIESLEPFGQSVTLNKSVAIPKSLARGTYVLTLRKDQTIQSESQVIRYRNPVTIHEIQPIAPQEFEAFRQNEIPLFSWNSIDNLSYQLMFSTDPAFADDSQIFRVPSEDWLTSKQYRPLPGEWNLIWLLSQSRESDIYWQIEAKSEQEGVITGMPQKILFNREQVN